MDEGNRPNFSVNKPHTKRVHVLFTDEQLAAIDEWASWRGSLGIRNRNEAIRELIRLGLEK